MRDSDRPTFIWDIPSLAIEICWQVADWRNSHTKDITWAAINGVAHRSAEALLEAILELADPPESVFEDATRSFQ